MMKKARLYPKTVTGALRQCIHEVIGLESGIAKQRETKPNYYPFFPDTRSILPEGTPRRKGVKGKKAVGVKVIGLFQIPKINEEIRTLMEQRGFECHYIRENVFKHGPDNSPWNGTRYCFSKK